MPVDRLVVSRLFIKRGTSPVDHSAIVVRVDGRVANRLGQLSIGEHLFSTELIATYIMERSEPSAFDYDEVDHLLRNAELRDQIEPYVDESICRVNVRALSTAKENEFLASMLAWERAPVLAIAEWFDPALNLPRPEEFGSDLEGEDALHEVLWDIVYKLFEKRIVLEFTDHLSDRELYQLIYRDILPSQEKKLEGTESYLHWDCADAGQNPAIYLSYYASDSERDEWETEHGYPPPPRARAPFLRQLPRRPL